MTSERDVGFTEFVTANRGRLERAARLLTYGNEQDAEDLVQQALTKLYVHWPRVARGTGPLTYSYRILTTTFIDESRRAWRRHERTGSLPAETGVPAPDADTRATVLAALAAVPPRQRAVIVLRYLLDQSVEQTATLLHCSEGTVKSQSAKALATLRIRLADVHTDTTHHGGTS
ncbi:SigE family RNA polymerase sigma factor [Flexivirga caeni]|uniref:SigE family RNA polymerase sigma factor n=1 Tax=Flexivirga caeni TaxID=2294115 RepID=A0A3M9MED8_9MICO|nr:SigE family RNA polymerase sigma factor [Flexivirga caeni]RNI23203.1 SigE family RNA polymerase sigma factor [Flexivirga caeni]